MIKIWIALLFTAGFVFFNPPTADAETYDLNLKQGMNFVSVPLVPGDPDINTIIEPISYYVNNIIEYRAADTADPWKRYHKGLEQFNDLSELHTAKGYWIDSKYDRVLTIQGTAPAAEYTLDLKAGWNAIGWPYSEPRDIKQALATLTFGTDYTQVSRFNPETKAQEDFFDAAGSDAFSEFEAGYGYYIYMLSDASVTLTPATAYPETPVLQQAGAGNGQVDLQWSPAQYALGYEIKYGTSSGSYDQTIDLNAVTSHTVTGLTNGTPYYFVVSARNSAGTSGNSNELSARPMPPNAPPSVDAGTDQEITLPDDANLSATVSDDGLPDGTLNILWSKVSGPGTVIFADAAQAATTASFSEAGTYELKITADDGELTSQDVLTVTVEPQNFPPTVDAGVDQEITLPDDANLSATVSDDGLPDGTLDTLWSKVSGPGTVTFGDASAAVTTASFSEAGTYELKITADDGELSMEDGLTVLVHPGNDVVIDNSDAEVEGSWNNSSYQAGYYGTDYLFTESGSGADKVRWRPILVGGDYNVYYWLPDGMSTRSTEAQYTVYFNGGSKTYLVNQQAVGGRWILLGTHSFLPGTGGYVELTDNNTAYYTIADAIKFECSGVCDGNVLEQVSGVSAVPADGQVNLSWSPVSGADGYYVRIGTSSDVYSDPVNVGAVTEYTVGDLTHGQTYYFRVSAYNTREEGPASEEISVDLPELNVVPEVDAGADQEITLPDAAGLSATINDDGLPSGMLEILWSKVSGPGTVTFGDASVEATTASFSESGTYELKITVDDGELIADDMLVVIVNPALQEITIIYTYDDLNRLEQVDRPTQTIRYDYDEVGNINAKSIY